MNEVDHDQTSARLDRTLETIDKGGGPEESSVSKTKINWFACAALASFGLSIDRVATLLSMVCH